MTHKLLCMGGPLMVNSFISQALDAMGTVLGSYPPLLYDSMTISSPPFPRTQTPMTYIFSSLDSLPFYQLLPATNLNYTHHPQLLTYEMFFIKLIVRPETYYNGVEGKCGRGCCRAVVEAAAAEESAVPFLLLSLAGFVVLKPVEHIFPFYLPVFPKLRRDLFDLLGVRRSHSPSVEHFQDTYLLLRRIPPRPAGMRLRRCRRLYPFHKKTTIILYYCCMRHCRYIQEGRG